MKRAVFSAWLPYALVAGFLAALATLTPWGREQPFAFALAFGGWLLAGAESALNPRAWVEFLVQNEPGKPARWTSLWSCAWLILLSVLVALALDEGSFTTRLSQCVGYGLCAFWLSVALEEYVAGKRPKPPAVWQFLRMGAPLMLVMLSYSWTSSISGWVTAALAVALAAAVQRLRRHHGTDGLRELQLGEA